jgi:hypothetical protein
MVRKYVQQVRQMGSVVNVTTRNVLVDAVGNRFKILNRGKTIGMIYIISWPVKGNCSNLL